MNLVKAVSVLVLIMSASAFAHIDENIASFEDIKHMNGRTLNNNVAFSGLDQNASEHCKISGLSKRAVINKDTDLIVLDSEAEFDHQNPLERFLDSRVEVSKRNNRQIGFYTQITLFLSSRDDEFIVTCLHDGATSRSSSIKEAKSYVNSLFTEK